MLFKLFEIARKPPSLRPSLNFRDDPNETPDWRFPHLSSSLLDIESVYASTGVVSHSKQQSSHEPKNYCYFPCKAQQQHTVHVTLLLPLAVLICVLRQSPPTSAVCTKFTARVSENVDRLCTP